jgi:transcriptional regulator with XRE-family HTH domain
MGTAARIRGLRIRAGKPKSEIAQSLGLNAAWYDDLEQRDDELVTSLTLFQAMELASLLGVKLHDIFEVHSSPDEHIALVDLPARITQHVAREGITVEQLEEKVGWELRRFLESPVQTAAECPIAFLQALAHGLGLDWLSFVPE